MESMYLLALAVPFTCRGFDMIVQMSLPDYTRTLYTAINNTKIY